MRSTVVFAAAMRHRAKGLAVLAVLGALAGAPAARASSYVMMADEDLADLATVVVHGTVTAVRVVRVGGAPYTECVVDVLDEIQGTVGETIVLRQLGGELPEGEGMSLKVFGLPQYAPGAGVVLFLSPWRDGTYRAVDLLLGSFHTLEVAGRTLAVRHLEGADEVQLQSARPKRRESLRRAHHPRDLDAWTDWLRDRAAGVERVPDYFVDPDLVPNSAVAKFTTFTTSNGQKIRWPDFDNGDAVMWGVHRKKLQKGLPSRGVSQAKIGLQTWNAIGNIAYGFLGKVRAPAAFSSFDGKNTVAYNDPNNDLPGTFSCASGGTLAAGGPWFGSATHTKGGKTYRSTAGADIVFQDGLTCFFTQQSRRGSGTNSAAEQINGHEGGHTLGIGHSCGDGPSGSCSGRPKQDDALMRALFHNDGRGAERNNDDNRAARSAKGMRYKGKNPDLNE